MMCRLLLLFWVPVGSQSRFCHWCHFAASVMGAAGVSGATLAVRASVAQVSQVPMVSWLALLFWVPLGFWVPLLPLVPLCRECQGYGCCFLCRSFPGCHLWLRCCFYLDSTGVLGGTLALSDTGAAATSSATLVWGATGVSMAVLAMGETRAVSVTGAAGVSVATLVLGATGVTDVAFTWIPLVFQGALLP